MRLSSDLHEKLTDEVLVRLGKRRIASGLDFVEADAENLVAFTGLSFKDVLNIKDKVLESFGPKICKVSDLLKNEQNFDPIPTGITSLDQLLRGGLCRGSIYEICGASSSGKSEICHTVAANFAMRLPNSRIYYIDTKRDFSGSRIHAILDKRGKVDDVVAATTMARIRVTNVASMGELFNAMHELVEDEDEQEKLLIVDSLPSIFAKPQKAFEVNYSLCHLASVCRYLACQRNLTLITVNLVSDYREIEFSWDQHHPQQQQQQRQQLLMLGSVWQNVPNTRLQVEKCGKEVRRVFVWRSSELKIGTFCDVVIGDEGVV